MLGEVTTQQENDGTRLCKGVPVRSSGGALITFERSNDLGDALQLRTSRVV